MRDLRRQNKSEPKESEVLKEVILKNESPKVENLLISDDTFTPSYSDLLMMQEKIAKLEKENIALKSSKKLSRNEEKVLSAIKSEILSQGTDSPIISTRNFLREYNMNSKYLGPATQSLLSKKIIKRFVSKTEHGQNSFRWALLQPNSN